MNKKIIIIGAGASGIFCAINIKKEHPEYSVTLLEQNNRIGKKILQTGNGKCNLSNKNMRADFYNNQEFISKCMEKYSLDDEAEFYNAIGLLTRVDSEGRVYPHTLMATTVLSLLIATLNRLDIKVITDFKVEKITKYKMFKVYNNSSYEEADIVVVACGSFAQAKTNGYFLLQKLGHSLTPLIPSLVSLKTERNTPSLAGIRVKCIGKILLEKNLLHEEEGEILFKGDSLSGILAMNLSRYYQEGCYVSLDLISELTEEELKEKLLANMKKYPLDTALTGIVPKMIALDILSKNKEVDDIIKNIKNYCFKISGLSEFQYAQITKGGVKITEIDDNFKSKIVDNLYIIGEVLDIDGMCGGYNLHFALMSAALCARNM